MKIHTKKKQFRLMCKLLSQQNRINDSTGQWVNRPTGGNSMMRDYSPQSGKE